MFIAMNETQNTNTKCNIEFFEALSLQYAVSAVLLLRGKKSWKQPLQRPLQFPSVVNTDRGSLPIFGPAFEPPA